MYKMIKEQKNCLTLESLVFKMERGISFHMWPRFSGHSIENIHSHSLVIYYTIIQYLTLYTLTSSSF